MPQVLPLLAYAGATAAGATGTYAWVASAVMVATSVAVADYQRSRANEKARAAAAAAARNRTITVRSGVAPRKYALGTVRLSGPLMYAEYVGTNEEYLDEIIALTHGEIGEFVGLYLNDEFVAVADIVDTIPMTGRYSGAAVIAERLVYVENVVGATTVTLPLLPSDAADVQAILIAGVGDASEQFPVTISSVVGTLVTFSEPLTGEVSVTYSSKANPKVPLRVLGATGASSQASTSWSGVSAPKWTADHRLRGVSYFRTLTRLESEVFATGLPEKSAVVRGPKGVYDPRTDTTVNHSSNPALLAAWFRTLPRRDGGIGVPDAWIDWDSVAEAADVCDELITVRQLDGSGYEDVKRYECHTVLSLDQPPEENLRIILDSMAGDFPYTAGLYRCYAGAFRAAAVTSTDADVAGDEPIVIAPLVGADQVPPNVVNATIYSAANNWMETGAPAVQNDTYIAADGAEEPTELDLPACTDLRQANYLMGVMLERMRPGLAGSMTLLGKGANIALMDTLQLDLEGYEALAGTTFEVRRRINHWNGRYTIEFREVRASTYTLDADRFTPPTVVDEPDDSGLWDVTPPDITSVANAAMQQPGGGVLARALVTWAAHPQRLVNPGGWIDVRYRSPDAEWTYATPVRGAETHTYLSPLSVGSVLFIEARARNGLGSVSEWVGAPPFTVTDQNDVPPDISGLASAIKPGQVVVSWDQIEEWFLYEVELRVGATWAGATFLWSGQGTDYKHARPPNGTYKVWAAYRNRARPPVYSANPQSIEITVDDSIDGSSGTVELTTDRDPYFEFPDGTSHVSSSPLLTMTAQLVGLQGLVSWTAKAYTSGGTLLGDITLGAGSGNVRTMTGAAFAAPGVSGSVAYADVRATHPNGAFDEVRVYRQDPTITTPRLYLTNRVASIATDEYGNGGDYSQASTGVAVVVGISNVSASWSFAITPDAGVTAAINGGAGPVTGTTSITVAVSAMTIPSGAVAIAASKTGETTLTDSFRVEKNEATSGLDVYWDPRGEIILPLGADGQVSSYADAYSSLVIARAGGQDDSATWAYAIDLLQNVTATLTGNRVDITGVVPLGSVGTSVSDSLTLPAGWTRPQSLVWTPLGWVMFGYHASGTWQHVLTSPDFLSWTSRDMGSAGRWEFGAGTDDGVVVAVEFGVAGTDKVIRSLDGGLTWGAVGSLGASAQWQSIQDMGDRIIVCPNGSTAGRQSTDNGGSWSALTLPDTSCDVFGGPGRYIGRSSSALYYRSANGGSSWSASIAALAGINSYTIKLFKGRLVFIPLAGSTARYSEDGGATWVTATLQHDVGSGPRMCEVVRGVLYLVGSDGKLQFTVDGKAWRTAGTTATLSQQILAQGGYRDIQADLLPCIYTSAGNYAVRTPLLATSEVEGGVRVRASKAGENDVVRFLPVRRGAITSGGYAFSASPRTLSLPSTSDGYVTDFSTASITVQAQKDDIDYTADWTVAWTATNMTPSSGSGATATFSAMNPATDKGTVTFSGSKPGENTVYGTFDIVKLKGTTSSGPRDGAIYAPVEAATTFVGVRFKTDGSVHVKRGSGGSYLPYAQWAGAVRSGAGTGVWIYVAPVAGTHALSSGTTGTWLELTSDRDFEMSDATSGTHRFEADLYLGTSSSGANAVGSVLRMTLIVP